MRRVAPDTYALGTRGHNFYVLRDGDEVTIIDAGCSREWSKLADGLSSVGLSPAAVRAIAATHSHADQFGLAARAADNEIPVAVHEEEEEEEEARALGTYTGRFAASAAEIPLFNLHALRNFLPMIRAGVTSLDHLDTVDTFTAGERLDLPGAPVLIHTPGHTEGQLMFHCPELGLLFTGDGLITMGPIGPHDGPQMIERRFSLDHDQALASLDRIVDLDAELLLPGHGTPWSGSPAAAVALARD